MPKEPETSARASEKHHNSVYIALIVGIILLIGIFAVFVYGMFSAPQSENMENATQDEAIANIQTLLQQLIETSDEEPEATPVKTKTFGSEKETIFPIFSYPATWEVASYTTELDTHVTHRLYVNEHAIKLCDECNDQAPIVMVNVEAQSFGDDPYADHIAQLRGAGTTVEHESIQTAENGTLYMFRGNAFKDGATSYPYETFFFVSTNGRVVTITYRRLDENLDEEAEGAWTIIKDSIDFTYIQ